MIRDDALPAEIEASLRRLGLVGAGEPVVAERLTGGVSSDIWKVSAGRRVFCVKRAMARLAVKDEWLAPLERNRYERLWFEVAGERVPGTAPRVLAHDDAAMFFAMEYLDPVTHRLWKPELLAGRADPAFAGAVGRKLAAIHAATAGDQAIAASFPTDTIFEALRLDAYLRATGRRHPALAPRLNALADRTAATKKALVHGDVSPKNIMIGPQAMSRKGLPPARTGVGTGFPSDIAPREFPVFLDAECAWYGDPAFDLAFCLNHLLLKCLHAPEATRQFLAAFDRLRDDYLAGVAWEAPGEIEARAASLLPGLMLARVDGKSPVEYLSEETAKARVRRVAMPMIEAPPVRLAEMRDAWALEMGQ